MLIESIKKCLSLDTNDINHLKENMVNETHEKKSVFKVLIFRLKQTIISVINDIHKVKFGDYDLKYRSKHLFFYGTVNQYNALVSVKTKIENSILVSRSLKSDISFSYSFGYLISWLFIPFLVFTYFISNKNDSRNNLACYIEDRFYFYGIFLWLVYFLNKIEPNSVFVANDHSSTYRLVKEACKFLNIPIIYIQHASVSEKFPKLDFDISLLEGEDALNKYNKKGTEGDIHLIGMPKFDEFYPYLNTNKSVSSIGISLNILDSKESIERLLNMIDKTDLGFRIIIRPHPRDNRSVFFKKMVERYNCEISYSRFEKSFEYLKKVDVNIAGETSIHLEASLMNVYPIYYQFGEEMKDVYGYIENQLITDFANTPNQLIQLIESVADNKPNVRNRSEYYVSTVNSEYDGKSSELVKEIITNYFEN